MISYCKVTSAQARQKTSLWFSAVVPTHAQNKQFTSSRKIELRLYVNFHWTHNRMANTWQNKRSLHTHAHIIRNLNFVHISLGSMRPGILSYLQQKKKTVSLKMELLFLYLVLFLNNLASFYWFKLILELIHLKTNRRYLFLHNFLVFAKRHVWKIIIILN